MNISKKSLKKFFTFFDNGSALVALCCYIIFLIYIIINKNSIIEDRVRLWETGQAVVVAGIAIALASLLRLYSKSSSVYKKDTAEERLTNDIHTLEEKVSSLSYEYKDRFEDIAEAKLNAIFSVDIKPLIEKKYAEQATNSHLRTELEKQLREIIRRANGSRRFYSLSSKLGLVTAIIFAFGGLVIPCLKIKFLYFQVYDFATLGSLIEVANKLTVQSILWLALPYLTAVVILESLAAVCFRIYANNKTAVQKLENIIISMEAFFAAYLVALHQNDTKEINRTTEQLLHFCTKHPIVQEPGLEKSAKNL